MKILFRGSVLQKCSRVFHILRRDVDMESVYEKLRYNHDERFGTERFRLFELRAYSKTTESCEP